ncbi:MAG: hypothetical protein CBB76_02500 [Crocinitomicaceae bacterium TMED16]|nr:MAG: hypothetical protein CBB76_02500 [Crocinitomicaceae bacterium TMED16]|tara:strand:- start:388 stop:810 length:423 start_codon:yes stop_codon:yes gene_type:complete
MFRIKFQKHFFIPLVVVFFTTMCFGQTKPLAVQDLKVSAARESSVPIQKKSYENTKLLCGKFKSLFNDLNNLDKNKVVRCQKSFNEYLRKNKLKAIVSSFEILSSMERSSIESICIKHPGEMKEIYRFIARDVKSVKAIK